MYSTQNTAELPAFPLQALPSIARHTADAVISAGLNASIVCPIISNMMAVGVQSVFDTELPNGGIVPTNNFTYINAISGSGKSVVRELLSEPLIKYQYGERAATEPVEAANAGIGEPDLPLTVITDFSPEGMLVELAKRPSIYIQDDEGLVLSMPRFRHAIATVLKVFDGQSIAYTRKADGLIKVKASRASFLIAVQPEITAAFDQKRGEIFRSSGFAARGLFVEIPEATPYLIDTDRLPVLPQLDVWNHQLSAFLYSAQTPFTRRSRNTLIKLNPQAKRCLAALHNRYQRRGMEGGDLMALPEHCARQMENAAKLATTWHAFEQMPGDVSGDTAERAACVIEWHTAHYKHRFLPKPKVSVAEQHATTLHFRLMALVKDTRQREFELRGLVDTAPNIGLSPGQAKRAFDFLCAMGYARYYKRNGKIWFELSPDQYPTIHFMK